MAGVFSADPRIVPDARKLPVVSFEEMLEMSASGAGVLQLRSVEYARNHGVRIHCRSSFDDSPGTVVVGEDETVEQPLITAVTHSTDEARVTLIGVPDEPGAAGRVFTALADANVNVDMIVQNDPDQHGRSAEISFTVPKDDLRIAREALTALAEEVGAELDEHAEMGKVSIVGAGMRSHPGVAAKVFAVLGHEGINIEMISTSPIKISCVIERDRVADAVRALHDAFELGERHDRRRAAVRPEGRGMSYRSRCRRRHGRRRPGDPAHARGARLPGRRARAFRLRALGRADARGRRRGPRRAGAQRRGDRRLRRRALSRPARPPRRSGRRASRAPAPS